MADAGATPAPRSPTLEIEAATLRAWIDAENRLIQASIAERLASVSSDPLVRFTARDGHTEALKELFRTRHAINLQLVLMEIASC